MSADDLSAIPVVPVIEPGTYTLAGNVHYVDPEGAWFMDHPTAGVLYGLDFRNVVSGYLAALSDPRNLTPPEGS